MAHNNFSGHTHFEGTVSFGSGVSFPASSIKGSDIDAGDPIGAEKVEHQFVFHHVQESVPDAALVSATKIVHVCRGIGEVMDIDASYGSVVPIDDEVMTIKVVKWTGAVSDDVMNADIVLDDGNVVHTPVGQAGLDAAGKVTAAGDILEIQVTKTGVEVIARGLIVNVVYKETPVD